MLKISHVYICMHAHTYTHNPDVPKFQALGSGSFHNASIELVFTRNVFCFTFDSNCVWVWLWQYRRNNIFRIETKIIIKSIWRRNGLPVAMCSPRTNGEMWLIVITNNLILKRKHETKAVSKQPLIHWNNGNRTPNAPRCKPIVKQKS